jgi:hypothetical protein
MRSWPLAICSALLIAGCGTTQVVTVIKSSATKPHSTVDLAASAKPTACIAYEYGQEAQVEFVSLNYNVQRDCQKWIQSSAQGNVYWTLQPPQNEDQTAVSTVCELWEDKGNVVATIVDGGGQNDGQAACNRLLAAGWYSPPAQTFPSYKSVKASGTTKIDLQPHGKAGRIEPGSLGFSGDGGNIVTQIVWSKWTSTEAVGQGESVIQNCNPSCAQGTNLNVTANIILLDPVGGHFTELLEERNGTTSIAAYGSQDNSMSPAVGVWPFT